MPIILNSVQNLLFGPLGKTASIEQVVPCLNGLCVRFPNPKGLKLSEKGTGKKKRDITVTFRRKER